MARHEWRRPDGNLLLSIIGDGYTPFADLDYQIVGIVEHWRDGVLLSTVEYDRDGNRSSIDGQSLSNDTVLHIDGEGTWWLRTT